MKKISKKRRELLIKLEFVIGKQCYNGNIQNYGAWGELEGEGREFRYPITFKDQKDQKIKKKGVSDDITDDQLITGYYAFGANQLHIIRGLNKVLTLLEESYGFKIDDEDNISE